MSNLDTVDAVTPDGKPAPGSAPRQAIIDQLAAVNAALSYLAADTIKIRLSERDPLSQIVTQLLMNSDRALALCAAVLESEQRASR